MILESAIRMRESKSPRGIYILIRYTKLYYFRGSGLYQLHGQLGVSWLDKQRESTKEDEN